MLQTKENWLMLCNAQSLLYKMDEMRALVTILKPTFICITETWLTPDITSDLVSIPGYTIFRNDRRDDTSDNRRGGGTLIFASYAVRPVNVDTDFKSVPNCHTRVEKPRGIECNLIKFYDPNISYLMCIYIPPALSAETFSLFENYIVNIFDYLLNDTPNADIFVSGDLNRYDFSFLTRLFDVSNIVKEPTFGNAILDKFYCNSGLLNTFNAKCIPPLGVTLHSHKIVLVSKNITKNRNGVHLQRVLDLRKSHMTAFRNSLLRADWSPLYSSKDPETSTAHLYNILSQAMSKIPVSYVKFKNSTKPWITPVLLDLINKRWFAYRNKNFQLYRHYRDKVKEEIIKSKKIWSANMCRTYKGVWSVVNDTRGTKSKTSVDQIVSLFSSPLEAAESVNAVFMKSFVTSHSYTRSSIETDSVPDICDKDAVFSLLSSLKTNKSPGSDGIYPTLLKASADVISKPLSYIFNLSFSRGIVPAVWKLADICPIPKVTPVVRDKFRPISLLPVMAKLLEEVVLRQYRAEFVGFYDSAQFAYRPLSSTVCALVHFHDDILKYLEDPEVVALRVLCFDMTHAFDCVPHDLLLKRISQLPFTHVEALVNWLHSYLYGRRQQVKLGCTRSSIVNVTSGVPQGSLLGPYLFALYMSTYTPVNPNVRVMKYADDISLLIPVYRNNPNDTHQPLSEVSMFQSWCDKYHMLINHEKTKVMHVNFSKVPVQCLQDYETVTHVKILGLIFNCKLTWSNHFDYIIACISKRLYVLRILKCVLTHDQLVIVYNSIVRSLFDYASPVFLNPGSLQESRLNQVCKRAFKIIHGFDSHNCERCDFFNIHERRQYLALRLFRNALANPDHVLHSILPRISHRSKRLILPHVTTSRRLNGFVFSCATMHNSSLL